MASIPTSGTLNVNINFQNEEGGSAAHPSAAQGTPAAPANLGLPNEDNPAASSEGSIAL